MTLSQGGVFSRVSKSLRGKYEIRTDAVVAGVRGTDTTDREQAYADLLDQDYD